MAQVLFDTHAAARKLEESGHTAQQAEAVVEVMSAATAFGARMAHDLERIKLQVENHMATKSDIANMATKADIANMATKADIANMATKADIANMATRSDIANMATKDDIANMATKDDIAELRAEIANTREVVREVLRQEAPAIHMRWLLSAGSLSLSLGGFAVMVLTNERLAAMLLQYGALIGLTMIVVSSVVMIAIASARSGRTTE